MIKEITELWTRFIGEWWKPLYTADVGGEKIDVYRKENPTFFDFMEWLSKQK